MFNIIGRRALPLAVANTLLVLGLIYAKEYWGGVAVLIPNSLYAIWGLCSIIAVNASYGLVEMWRSGYSLRSISYLIAGTISISAVLLGCSLPLVKNKFGRVKRRAIGYEIENRLMVLGSDSGWQYRFEDRSAINHTPVKFERVLEKTLYDKERFSQAMQRARGVDTERYLNDILAVVDSVQNSAQQRVENIVSFVQKSVLHDAFGQSPLAHPVVVLEYGRAHCTITNQYVLRTLLAQAGFSTRPAQLIHHSILEVRIGENWLVVDADMFDEVLLNGEGRLPALDWLRQAPNYYRVDQYARGRAFFDHPVNEMGERISGMVSTGRIEDLGYPSYHYGAPLEFPPSRPRLLQKHIETKTGEVALTWDRTYDRDGDLQYYLIEVGTEPGDREIGSYKTRENTLNITLEYPGKYYYRVRAVDQHIRQNNKTYYLPSADGTIRWSEHEDYTAEQLEKRGEMTEESHIASTVDLDAFQLIDMDSTYTALFDIPWRGGRGVRMVDMSNPYSPQSLPFPTRSTKVQRYQQLLQLPAEGRIDFDLEVKKSEYGGLFPIPIVAIGSRSGGWQILLEVLPDEHALILRPAGKIKSPFDYLDREEIIAEYKVFHVTLEFKNKRIWASLGGGGKAKMIAMPEILDDAYIELMSNGHDQIDYVFANLTVAAD